jgi:hypothetical protein
LGTEPITVERNDLIQTNPGTFLDVQLLPGRTRVRIAEYSTVALVSVDGEFSADLVYGKILVDAREELSITSHGAAASSDSAVFGADFVAERAVGSLPVTLLYVIDGTLTVGPATDESVEDISRTDTAQLADGDMARAALVRSEDTGSELVLETDAVDAELLDYWADRDFAAVPLSAAEVVSRYPSLEPRLADWPAASGEEPAAVATPEPDDAAEEGPDASLDQEPVPATPAPPREEVLERAIPQALQPTIRKVDYTGAKRFLRGAGLTGMAAGMVAEGIGLLLLFAGEFTLPDVRPELVDNLALGLTIGGGASVVVGLSSYIVSNVLGGSPE